MSRVLIFDDDADILELCALVLQTRGFETATETDCRNVIKRIREVAPDVILMDNWIPDMGGIAATQLIKSNETTAHIPVVFFSANSNVESYSKDANADYYLKKPFDISDLENIVVSAINNQKQASSFALSDEG